MKFIPFEAPPTISHPLATGLTTEGGVTAHNLVKGVNAYFAHIFEVLKGDVGHVTEIADDEARKIATDLAEHVTALEMKNEVLQASIEKIQADIASLTVAQGVVGAPVIGGDPNADSDPITKALKQATNA